MKETFLKMPVYPNGIANTIMIKVALYFISNKNQF